MIQKPFNHKVLKIANYLDNKVSLKVRILKSLAPEVPGSYDRSLLLKLGECSDR